MDIEEAKQAVVQHFGFSGGRVADVNLHRVVLGDLRLDGFLGKAKLQDVPLHASEAGGCGGFRIGFLGSADPEIVREQGLHIASRAPPSGQ